MTMARLTGTILTDDDLFRTRVSETLRSGSVRVSVIDERLARGSAAPDIAIIDGRRDPADAMLTIERLRSAGTAGAIFMIMADPLLIIPKDKVPVWSEAMMHGLFLPETVTRTVQTGVSRVGIAP